LWLGSFWIASRWGFDVLSWIILVILLYVAKIIYVKFIRFDVVFNCPVLNTLSYPVNGAHRGGSQLFGPENTLYNYRRSVNDLRAQILEIDLRLTEDDHIILFHDTELSRTTNGIGDITNKTLDELRSLDAAWNYPELRGTGITIPTLDEVLIEFTPTPVVFFFDIKDARVIPKLPAIISQWNLTDRLIVGAVIPGCNKALQNLLPKSIPIAPDFVTVVFMLFTYVLGLSWLLPTKHALMGAHIAEMTKQILTPSLFSDWKKRNMKIVLFGDGLNDAETQKQCIRDGVDILLTDRPDIARDVLRSK